MKHFVLGLIRITIIVILLPILFPLMIIDIIFWMGGRDPFNTPISPIREKIASILFREFSH